MNKTLRGLVAAVALSAVSSRLLAEEPIYVVEEMKGNVTVVEAGQSKARRAELEDILDAGDEIRTGADGSAELTLNQATSVHLGPNSRLKVAELKANGSGGFFSRLKLLAGKVVSHVEKLSTTKSTFAVEAGSAVAGVRGTLFEVALNGEDDVEATTEEGEVDLASGQDHQSIGPGMALAFRAGKRQALRHLALNERERFRPFAVAHARVLALRVARAERLLHPRNAAEKLRNEAFLKRRGRRKALLGAIAGHRLREAAHGHRGRGKGKGKGEDEGEGEEGSGRPGK